MLFGQQRNLQVVRTGGQQPQDVVLGGSEVGEPVDHHQPPPRGPILFKHSPRGPETPLRIEQLQLPQLRLVGVVDRRDVAVAVGAARSAKLVGPHVAAFQFADEVRHLLDKPAGVGHGREVRQPILTQESRDELLEDPLLFPPADWTNPPGAAGDHLAGEAGEGGHLRLQQGRRTGLSQ